MSYKCEVIADASGKWCSNALRFATIDEAQGYAKDLYRRWTSAEAFRVVSSDEPVTHAWIGDRLHDVEVLQ